MNRANGLPQQRDYIVRWIAGVAAFDAFLVAVGNMQWPWALVLAPTLGWVLGRQAYRRALAEPRGA